MAIQRKVHLYLLAAEFSKPKWLAEPLVFDRNQKKRGLSLAAGMVHGIGRTMGKTKPFFFLFIFDFVDIIKKRFTPTRQ
jgi:hypothetical protein